MNEKEHITDKSTCDQNDSILAFLPEESQLELELGGFAHERISVQRLGKYL